MLFQRIVLAALLVGVVAGLVLSLGQHWQVSPIIYAAEVFEVVAEAAPTEIHEHAAGAHSHGESWSPEDGAERIFYTTFSDVLAAIGFSSLMLVAMSGSVLFIGKNLNLRQGLLWGLAGYAVFFIAPALGLPPEIPGMEAAALAHRQPWWLLAATLTAAGLALLAFAPSWKKAPGALLLVAPHVLGAPQHPGASFSHPDPAAVLQLEQLHHQFLIATTLTNAAFWLVIGLACAFATRQWVLKDHDANR